MRKYDGCLCKTSAKHWFLLVSAIVSLCHSYIIPTRCAPFFYSDVAETILKRSLLRTSKFRRMNTFHEATHDSDPGIRSKPPIETSAEENLRLGVSIASFGFLKNIEEYGNARMARRAVGILSKMPAYREIPKQEHYTAAIWACENSDQFKLAMSVFEEMKAAGIERVTRTYEGLISVAEKTKNWQAAMKLYDQMVAEGIKGSTEACNSFIWAAEQGGRYDFSLNMLKKMEADNIARNSATYAACAYSCEKAGEGETSLHVMDLMRTEGYEINTPVYKAAIWACVKAGMWERSLSLFEEMEVNGVLRDEDCYSGAIWACVGGTKWQKSVELLKLMKFEGLQRKTVCYDGALTALQQGGQWEACLDMITWMDREIPATAKSPVTYQTVLQALDDACKIEEMKFIYLQALRDNYFVPWVKGSRLADFRGYTLPVAKVALLNILQLMKDGKLALFNLHIAVCDAPQVEEWTSPEVDMQIEEKDLNTEPSFDVQKLEYYLSELDPKGTLICSNVKLEGLERIVLSVESLASWSNSDPLNGYEDIRNVWVEKQQQINGLK